MTDQEIDFALALAIGYAPDRVRNIHGWVQVRNSQFTRMDGPMHYSAWQRFDHKDPAVIWPIAERFDAFPVRNVAYRTTKLWGTKLDSYGVAHNPATATALAVIEHCKKFKL